jgi:hypothetical protein
MSQFGCCGELNLRRSPEIFAGLSGSSAGKRNHPGIAKTNGYALPAGELMILISTGISRRI